jgi:ribosomal protein S12 methylthiotransferase
MATMARLAPVLPYLDMPIQHIASRMLKRMGRRHTREETCELLSKLRERVPGIVLRTTFITGFPGETLEEHQELVRFVREFRFERLGVFPYSHEESTPAGERFEDDVPAAEKERRAAELMETQQEIAFAHARSQVGRELDVVVEAAAAEPPVSPRRGRTVFVARSSADAPEIDPVVYLEAPADTELGSFVRARGHEGLGYDLVARALAPSPRQDARRRPRRLPLARGS